MYAEIIISSASKEVDRIFHYMIPSDFALCVGMRVIVPFGRGNKKYEGYVVGLSGTADIDDTKLKPVLSVLDEYPIFDEGMLGLALHMKERYFTTLSLCIACIIPYGIKMRNSAKITKRRLRLKGGASLTGGFAQTTPPALTAAQKDAFDFISAKIEKGDTKPTLIQGVTGSGKTEVYLRLIDKVLKSGKAAIALVPEISLTPQAIELFAGRFGDKVCVTHSRLSPGERFDSWQRAKLGEISVMVGPRSAIFTPFANLGIIIIDEEHDHSYKSDQSPKYSAKEIALYLSSALGAHLIMGSATPSLESYYEAQTSIIDLVRLDERVNNDMPNVLISDMRRELITGNASIFSRALAAALKNAISNNEQAILFLNRRGHSTFVSCRKCGFVMACDDCSVNFTYHRHNNSLICHYCGKTADVPENCPQCGSKYIKYFGVGTQKVEEEVKKLLPDVKTLRMDADTTSAKHGHETILRAFRERQADILIGTQMIAKGLDYPFVTVVGIICADTSLNLGDFRSAETTFQLITQAAGRAGRAELSGQVFIQTYNPEHYSIAFAKTHNYDGFYAYEIAVRRQMSYPPFAKIFGVLFTGPDEKKIVQLIFYLAHMMKHYDKNNIFEVIGPAPAIISKIKNNYRWRIIVKSQDEDKLRKFCVFCADKLKKMKDTTGVTIGLTPNPVNVL